MPEREQRLEWGSGTRYMVQLILVLLLLFPAAGLADENAFARALVFFKGKEYGKALGLFQESSSSLSSEKEAERLYYIALCYLHTGKREQGLDYLHRVKNEFPASPAAKEANKYILEQLQVTAKNLNLDNAKNEPEEIAFSFRRTRGGQLAVHTQLNGHSLEMIFDTGAEECLLGRNQMALVDLSNANRSKSATLNSVSGPIRIFQIMADIKVASLKKRIPVCVQDADMNMGILGQPFFKGYSCFVDNQSGLIRLHKLGAGRLAPLDSFAVPFTENGDKLIVSVKLNDRYTDMCFDTGAFGVCLSKAQSEKAGLKLPESTDERTRGPNGMQVSSWQAKADIMLGSIHKRDCAVRVLDSNMSYPLLGQNFFGDRSYVIDRQKKEIRFYR